jgi:hypothetical protein
MSRTFNAVMRVISSFMQGDQHWVFYGAIMLIVGVCQVVWSNTRQRE